MEDWLTKHIKNKLNKFSKKRANRKSTKKINIKIQDFKYFLSRELPLNFFGNNSKNIFKRFKINKKNLNIIPRDRIKRKNAIRENTFSNQLEK